MGIVKQLKVLQVVIFPAMALVLAACSSFAPVYGSRTESAASSIRFNYADPDDRLEQLVLNRLSVAFPARATAADPILDIAVSVRSLAAPLSDSFAVAIPARIRVQAVVTITQGDEIVFEALRFVDTAYQTGKLASADISASQGAQESAARSVAESVRAAILAGYRPATMSAIY